LAGKQLGFEIEIGPWTNPQAMGQIHLRECHLPQTFGFNNHALPMAAQLNRKAAGLANLGS
jgi:hypothetical protein